MDGNVSLIILIIVTRRKKDIFLYLVAYDIDKGRNLSEPGKTMTKLLGVENKK